MSQTAPSNILIRMPTPTGTYNTSWANTLISAIELQSRNQILAQTSSSKSTEDIAEALAWFYG
jgi:hypothetical protein